MGDLIRKMKKRTSTSPDSPQTSRRSRRKTDDVDNQNGASVEIVEKLLFEIRCGRKFRIWEVEDIARREGQFLAQAVMAICYVDPSISEIEPSRAKCEKIGSKCFTALQQQVSDLPTENHKMKVMAAHCMAEFYMHGIGIEQNDDECIRLHKYAAERGNIFSVYCLGLCFDIRCANHIDFVESVTWYELAERQGYGPAMFELGNCYLEGRGVARNEMQALQFYHKALQSNRWANTEIGRFYENGWAGLGIDTAEAFHYYQAGADAQDALGAYEVGRCYYHGIGIPRDRVEAVRYFRMAAEKRHVTASFMLGQCYRTGTGVQRNLLEAMKWLEYAAGNGHDEARDMIELLEMVAETLA